MAKNKHTIGLSDEQNEILYAVAKAEGQTKTEILEAWIRLGMAQYVRNKQAGAEKPLKDQTLKYDEAVIEFAGHWLDDHVTHPDDEVIRLMEDDDVTRIAEEGKMFAGA